MAGCKTDFLCTLYSGPHSPKRSYSTYLWKYFLKSLKNVLKNAHLKRCTCYITSYLRRTPFISVGSVQFTNNVVELIALAESWVGWLGTIRTKNQKILQAGVSTYNVGNNITDKHKLTYSIQDSYLRKIIMFRWTCTCNKINIKFFNASCVSQQPWHYRTTNIKSRAKELCLLFSSSTKLSWILDYVYETGRHKNSFIIYIVTICYKLHYFDNDNICRMLLLLKGHLSLK